MNQIKTQSTRIGGCFGSALVFMVLLLAVLAGMAQEVYHPITDGCIWSVSNEKYMTVGDTVLDGKTYLKIYHQIGDYPFEFSLEDAEYFAAIRNDVAGKKVYAYLPARTLVWDHSQGHHVTDTGMEVVLYDFSPQMDENFSYYTICPSSNSAMEICACRAESAYMLTGYENGHAHNTCYVDSDSLITMSDGTTRKRILLQTDGTIFEEVWIEGVGRLRGFDDFSIVEAEFPFRMLLCFGDSTGASYQTGFDFDGLDDCFNYGHGGGDVPEREMWKVKIYPNPTDDLLFIELRGGAEIANVTLYDLQGRMMTGVCDTPQQGGIVTITVKSIPAGVYVLRVTDADGHEYHQKIVRK